ncbi:hypothetical protein IG631_04673 [Alternaria alternata]|nr:hypothetical protein IG631_04673 [Alternaria alternata]
MSRYFPTPTKAKPRINPLIKLFVWRCPDDGCKYVNETLANERGYVRMISTGEELPEAMWYGEKCEMCRQKAGTTVAPHTMLVIVALQFIAVGLAHVERAGELSPTLIGFCGRVLRKPRA